MHSKIQFNRRALFYGPLALSAAIGGSAPALAYVKEQPKWETGTAEDFKALVNRPFTAMTKEGKLLHLTLVEARAGNSGPARPKGLSRSESVTLTFRCKFEADLESLGHDSAWVWNSTLGQSQLLLGSVPRKSGGYDIELILN